MALKIYHDICNDRHYMMNADVEWLEETNAARLAERDANLREQYLPRLMDAMERANAVNFRTAVHCRKFTLTDRDDNEHTVHTLSPEYDNEAFIDLIEFEWEVKHKENKEEEENRKFNLRQKALSKLTAEERKLLGLL